MRWLLVDETQHLWGRMNRESGAIELAAEQSDTQDSDLLDELCEVTLLRGGEVITLPSDRMPTGSPVAGVFRF